MDTLAQARSRVALAVRFANSQAERTARADLGVLRVQRAIQADLAHLRPQDRADLAAMLTGTVR